MKDEIVAISSDEEWEEPRATPVRVEDSSDGEETFPQETSREDKPHANRVHSIHHSTIDVLVALEDMVMILRANFTTAYVQMRGVQRTKQPHARLHAPRIWLPSLPLPTPGAPTKPPARCPHAHIIPYAAARRCLGGSTYISPL
ncbi:hypothetical protein AWZ03_014745 [Drosophila navojoa]|uniref:Uncharacterized protein n=1 Tax=Drosophila navojoa TaxID=7232 RepID=A0A484AR21_DRONA|nr:hypothetical protein AWZ03_014745 [Drosophila navojoa]